MTLRNVPITYTLDQQRQEINNLAGDVNDLDVNFNEKIDDRINGLITAGTGIAAVYDDTANTYTLALDFTEFTTNSLTEGVNGLFYTSVRAISEIDNRVTKTFVNNLLVTQLGNLAQINLQDGADTATITPSNYNSNNWDTAYGWGDHSQAGYVTSVGALALNDITDVNVSGVVTDGHVLKWDGSTSRWIAAPDLSGGGGGGGGGISLTDISANSLSASGGGSLTYNSTSGTFTYTPPDLSAINTDTLDSVTGRGATTSNNITAGGNGSTGGITLSDGSVAIRTGTGNVAAIDLYCEVNNAHKVSIKAPLHANYSGNIDFVLPPDEGTNGYVLSTDGAGTTGWVAQSGGGGGGSGLTSRTTGSATATSLADAASADITINAAKAFTLLKIQTSHAAWVTLYTDTASRTADAGRTETTDPLPGSGVLAEIITSDGATQIITPGTIGWNNDPTPSTNIYAKVVNKSGSTANIAVTLTYVQLEV